MIEGIFEYPRPKGPGFKPRWAHAEYETYSHPIQVENKISDNDMKYMRKIGAWSGSIAWVTSQLHTHKCYPTTDWCGYFKLLSFLPRPFRISLDNLDSSSSQELTILTPALARTPNRHAKLLIKLPDSYHPQDSSPPVAWVTDSATKSSYS